MKVYKCEKSNYYIYRTWGTFGNGKIKDFFKTLEIHGKYGSQEKSFCEFVAFGTEKAEINIKKPCL